MVEGLTGHNWEPDLRGYKCKLCFHDERTVTAVTIKRIFTTLANCKGEVKLICLFSSKTFYGMNGVSLISLLSRQKIQLATLLE